MIGGVLLVRSIAILLFGEMKLIGKISFVRANMLLELIVYLAVRHVEHLFSLLEVLRNLHLALRFPETQHRCNPQLASRKTRKLLMFGIFAGFMLF